MSKKDNQVINLTELYRNIELAKKDGKDVVMNHEADKAIAFLKVAEKQIEEAIVYIRELAKDALKPFNAKTLKGKYVTITVSAPRKVNEYSVTEDADSKFWKKEIKIIPNKEEIEKYLEENESLPIGVIRNELKSSVSIRLKQSALDDINSENES